PPRARDDRDQGRRGRRLPRQAGREHEDQGQARSHRRAHTERRHPRGGGRPAPERLRRRLRRRDERRRRERARQARAQGDRSPGGQRREPAGHRLRGGGRGGAAARPLGRRAPAAADAEVRRRRCDPLARAGAARCRRHPEGARLARMATGDPRGLLADALGALGETLRHHRDLGFTDLPTAGDYLLGPAEALRALEKAVQGCRKCKLCEARSTIVFGSGNPRAELVVIGEGPGADEDAQGLPFVGRAGQLLTKMLEARKVELSPICTAGMCRPPGNRTPQADELAACAPFLAAKLAVLQPKVVLALGSVATQSLLGTREPIGKLRGRVHPYGSAVLIPTFHPAFLLRNPGEEYKRMAWEDLQLARREYDRRRTR